MTRAQATAFGVLAVGGAIAAGVLLRPGPAALGADGGALPNAPTLYALPDGGSWPIAPDAGLSPASTSCGATPGLQTCVVLTPTGYAEYQVFVPADGGQWLYSSTVGFDYRCADSSGTCLWVADGGVVPMTGSYPAAQVVGAGCLPRPSVELAGWSGAPAGCQP